MGGHDLANAGLSFRSLRLGKECGNLGVVALQEEGQVVDVGRQALEKGEEGGRGRDSQRRCT